MDIKGPDVASAHINRLPCQAHDFLPYVAFLLMMKVNCPSFLSEEQMEFLKLWYCEMLLFSTYPAFPACLTQPLFHVSFRLFFVVIALFPSWTWISKLVFQKSVSCIVMVYYKIMIVYFQLFMVFN